MELIPTLQPVEDPTPEQVEMPLRKLWPMESPHRSRLLAGTSARGGDPTLQQGQSARRKEQQR